jgi:hypothetical protein
MGSSIKARKDKMWEGVKIQNRQEKRVGEGIKQECQTVHNLETGRPDRAEGKGRKGGGGRIG